VVILEDIRMKKRRIEEVEILEDLRMKEILELEMRLKAEARDLIIDISHHMRKENRIELLEMKKMR
jgi:hypothetical protein